MKQWKCDTCGREAEFGAEFDAVPCRIPNNRPGDCRGVLRTLDDPRVKIISTVLLDHHRSRIQDCACGWAELGKSHSDHVARAILTALRETS